MDDLPLLSEDLLNELDGMDNAILPSKKKKKKGKRGVPDGAVEIAKKISKREQKRIALLEKRKETNENADKYLEILQKHRLTPQQQALMNSSRDIGKTRTVKEELKRILKRQKAGLEITKEEQELLFPLSKLVEIKSSWQKTKKINFENIKTICVGNIYLGGTGKTSVAIELKKILDEQNIKSCFIRKKYSNQIDEQRLLEKFGKIFVDKSRVEALKSAVSENFKVAIFDDGLQDKDISYDITFVCFNKKNLIGNGRIIPAGPLRESLDNLEKYQNIFFNGNDEDNENLRKNFNLKYSNLNFFESKYELLNLNQIDFNKKYVVFSGIGNHQTFLDMLKKNKLDIIQNFEFSDHYNYLQKDIERITKFAFKNNAKILTTEKDYLRLNKQLQAGIDYTKINLNISEKEK